MQTATHLIPLGSIRLEFSGGKTGEVLNSICGINEKDRPGSGH